MGNEVAERKTTAVQTLTNNLNRSLDAVAEALPNDFNKARFLQNTIAVVKDKPDLLQFNQNELLTCCLQASYLGLDFMNKEAWLVPYSGHVQFQLGYRGACKFVKKYSIRPLADIYAKAVRKGDELEYGVDENRPYIKWKPVPFNNSEVVGVFAVAYFKDGGILYEVMSKEDVDKIRNRSKAGRSGPWVSDYEEMAKKTVLKRLAKGIETDFDNVEQRSAWEADNDEFGRPEDTEEVVNPFAKKEEPKEEDIVDSTAKEIDDMETPFGEVNNG